MAETSKIISLSVHNLSFRDSVNKVTEWGLSRKSGFVCFANVHMTIEAYLDSNFRRMLDKASLVLPDGKPLALACNWLFQKKQERVAGMDFMPAILEKANESKAGIFLYGSTDEILTRLVKHINQAYPDVNVTGAISPPFRNLTEAELEEYISTINKSEAHFVFVALGCPKQEKWMAANFPSINAILLGVGGVFPVMAGLQKRSPKWMQDFTLEWLYRLLQEPRRMFHRYFYTNTYFIWLLSKEFVKRKFKLKS